MSDLKTYHAYTSKEGGQTSYYFTDAKEVAYADQEALKKAIKAFNTEEPKIERIDNDFIGLPSGVEKPYVWFTGAEGLYGSDALSMEEINEALVDAEVEEAEEERQATAKKSAPKKAAKKK